MSKVSMQAFYAAQAIASEVAKQTLASDVGVVVSVAAKPDGLYYIIWTTRNGAMEETRLFCSVTGVDRLTAHTTGFIDNVTPKPTRKPIGQ